MLKLPFSLRRVARAIAAGSAGLALLHTPAALAADVSIARVWQYAHNPQKLPNSQKSEIVTHDALTDTLWVAGTVGVDVLSRQSGQLLAHIPVTNFGAVNSVAIHDGVAALAIESTTDRTSTGVVVFFDTTTRQQLGAPVAVGSLPDMLTFTPDGARVLVANEGTPNPRASTALSALDPVGSVSVIDVATRAVVTLPVTPQIPGYDTLRLFPGTLSAYDPEPEYIAVDKTGKFAYVGLQEANGIAVLNLQTLQFERIFSLGLKDFAKPGNELDATDRDGGGAGTGVIRLQAGLPLFGLYQPDTIATYAHRGRTYLVMANEGDSRDNGDGNSEDEVRASAFNSDVRYARATLSTIDSSAERLVMFGARSFSIRDTDGNVVFDSGSDLDRKAIDLGIYDDTRSDNKGVEPEGVALLEIKGRVLAFIGLERTTKSAFAVYDITDPKAVSFVDMVVSDGDRSVEGLKAFKIDNRYYVAIANEVSDTTSLFEVSLFKGRGLGR